MPLYSHSDHTECGKKHAMTQCELEWALALLRAKSDEQAYATVTFHFQNGKIQMVKTETTVKPPVDGPAYSR